jgi:NRPS condensation-like uncharacterized protein
MPLPLPLVPFEQYMLFDDRPAYPMTFFIRLHFSGRVNLSALQTALPAVLARHPLLCAVVRKTGRRFEWVPSPSEPAITVVSLRAGACLPCPRAIDLRHEPGLRMWAVEDAEPFHLLLQFHHACCDALGAFVFLEHLLTAYAQATGAALNLRAPDQQSLRRRGQFGSSPRPFLPIVRQKVVSLRRAWRFVTHRPLCIVPRALVVQPDALPTNYPSAYSRQLTAVESLRLHAVASQQGATLNDLLARDWFLAVNVWKTRHFPKPSGGWLRLCVPINLRTEDHRGLSAANVVSMVFLDRRRKDLTDPDRLLRGIHREMHEIKRLGLGETFVAGMGLFAKLPDRLMCAVGPDRCWATGVLSNLGVLLTDAALPTRDGRLELDGAVLDQIDFLPSLRPGTFAAFGAFTYADQLCLTLHYDPRAIEPLQAEGLIDTFVEQLRSSGEEGDR